MICAPQGRQLLQGQGSPADATVSCQVIPALRRAFTLVSLRAFFPHDAEGAPIP